MRRGLSTSNAHGMPSLWWDSARIKAVLFFDWSLSFCKGKGVKNNFSGFGGFKKVKGLMNL
jgi:hypothetical protein